MKYRDFIEQKTKLGFQFGFDPVFIPKQAFDFQSKLIEFAVRKGRAGIFAECGLGKTLMQLTWAENVARKTKGRVLILTPIAVGHQTVEEAHKFGIDATRSQTGKLDSQIVVTNYQRLHYYKPEDFQGVVCDESAILKSFDGATRKAITEFMSSVKYRSLYTATPSPNDYMELGTSAEALGVLRYVEMLAQFFTHDGGDTSQWRLKKHTESHEFWRWVCSWARACRHPKDMGCDQMGFDLPPLDVRLHTVKSSYQPKDMLFKMPARGLSEQRQERKGSIEERCEKVAELVESHKDQSVIWCHLNKEGDTLANLISDSVQISGNDDDEMKEETILAFERGEVKRLISKPTIFGYGLNLQCCAHTTFFPSHSFEQWYQCVRRFWRFGQKKKVVVDIVTSDGESDVLHNMQRKQKAAEVMFENLVRFMNSEQVNQEIKRETVKETMPLWLKN